MDSTSPFALVLAGQPLLRQRLRLGAFTALDQRVALRYALPGLRTSPTRLITSLTISNWPY